jgi:hypothetical protein
MYLAHIHLLLNHWPIIGSFIALGLFLVSLVANSDDLKQASLALFALIALVTIPTYMSGSLAQEVIKESPGVSKALIQTHQGAALLAFLFMEITGAVALVGLWQFSRISRPLTGPVARWNSSAVLFFSVVTVGLMTITGNTGGGIRHPEILSGQETLSIVGTAGSRILPLVQYWVIDYSHWVWPTLETLHFLGLILTVATVATLNLRLLGFLKQLPVAPLHRLLPWGIAGFVINVITGILFFVGMPYFYVFNIGLHFKMLTILLAGGNLLLFYCTGAFRAWQHLRPGEDAPLLAKFIAASSIFLWFAVIVLGRYLPFTEDTLR